MSQKKIYILHGLTFIDQKRADVEPFIVAISVHDSLIYKTACQTMLQDLKLQYGSPKRIENDDDLDDPDVFINQQLVTGYDIYKNTDKIKDGPNKGKIRLSWGDRYRRIDAIYEKLRPEPKNHEMAGKYYYITAQPLKSFTPTKK